MLISSQWIQELISYEVTGLKPGHWVFKCIVTDSNGNTANASITIIIPKDDKIFFEGAFSILAILAYISIKRFNER